MKAEALIREFRELPLAWSTGPVALPPQYRPVDWSVDSGSHILVRVDQSVDDVYAKLMDDIFFASPAHYLGDTIDFESFPVSSESGARFFNARFVRLSPVSCAFVGSLSRRAVVLED